MVSLYGGGYQQAVLQVSLVYYGASIALHWIGPWLLPVKSIQVQERQKGQVIREATYSLGESTDLRYMPSKCILACVLMDSS